MGISREQAQQAKAEAEAQGDGPEPFPFTFLRDVRVDLESKFVIHDVVPYQALGEIYAPPGGGKTAISADMGLHIAAGRQYRGRRTEQQPVVYIALEGHNGIDNRIAAARQHLGLDGQDIPFALIKIRADFRVKETAQRVAANVKAMIAHFGFQKPNPVIFVDTFQAALGPGGNDCNPEHVTMLIENVKDELIGIGCTVVVVHHTGKDAAKGSRGWSGLLGALDFELEIDRKKDARFMYLSKQRDGSDEQPAFCYRLHGLELGRNQYGEPVTAVVVEHLSDAEGTAKGNRLTPTAQSALNVLWKIIKGETGQAWPLHGCPGMMCTIMGVWKKACLVPGAISNCKQERDRAAKFRNALEELQEKERIICDGKDGQRVYPRRDDWSSDDEIPDGDEIEGFEDAA
jgi:AAA domain